MPGGDPDPMVTADFLNAVRACQWNGGHLVGSGVVYYPHVRPERGGPGTWELSTSGLSISIEIYRLLTIATANGSEFFTAGSRRYTLRSVLGYAVAVEALR